MSHHSGENHDGFTPSWRLTQAAADRERRANARCACREVQTGDRDRTTATLDYGVGQLRPSDPSITIAQQRTTQLRESDETRKVAVQPG